MKTLSSVVLTTFVWKAGSVQSHSERSDSTRRTPPRWLASDREQADLAGAIQFARRWLAENERPTQLGLFGVSRGGGAAILAATSEPDVAAIVTDGVFSGDLTLEYLMRRFATIFARIRVVAENHPPLFWRFLRWLLFRECARQFGCRFPSVRRWLQDMHWQIESKLYDRRSAK